uniref:Nuclear casein kinase and cyclin-dependent kinase substrate 1a n=1 Tax=Fundulus heteroclitus TaxID=8078 RepID=A0A3Q2PJI2_FUNHE
MSRPVRNRKVVNYSQFNESDDADEEYGEDKPKKVRSAPREPKHKRSKNSQDDSEDSEEKLSKSKNDSADDFGSEEEDNDFGEEEDEEGGSDYEEERGKKAKKTKVEKPSSKRGPKRKRAADDSDDDKEVSRKRTVRQAASKAVSKQREILLGDGGSEDEEHEDQEEPYMDPDESGSDEDFMVEDDDDSDYGRSKKKGKKVIRRGRPDKKEKKSPKPRLKATDTDAHCSLSCSTWRSAEGVPSCSTAAGWRSFCLFGVSCLISSRQLLFGTVSLWYIQLCFLFCFFMLSQSAPPQWLQHHNIRAVGPGTSTSFFVSRNAARGVFLSFKTRMFFFLLLVHCSNSLFRFFCNVCFLRKLNKMYLDFKEKLLTLSNLFCVTVGATVPYCTLSPLPST